MWVFRGSALISVFVCLIAGFIGFSFFSPYFELNKITIVRDNPHVNPEKITALLSDFYGKNLLTLKKSQIEKRLRELFPEITQVQIHEKWPAEIKLKVTMSPPFLTLLNQETANFSVIAQNGVILDIPAQKELLVVKVYDYPKDLMPHQKFLTQEVLDQFLLAKTTLEQDIELPVKSLHYYPLARELHLISLSDVEIWLDLQRPIPQQLRKLKEAAERLDVYKTPFRHIDLRIAQQIFWATK